MAIALKVQAPSSSFNPTTLIEFLLDETGSMMSCRDATISGFNEYVQSQKMNQSGSCLLSLTKFDSRGVNPVYQAKSVQEVPFLDANSYIPNASTNLYDAIGERIRAVEAQLPGLPPETNVLMVIMTDGFDNCSMEFNAESIKTLIKDKESKGWSFVYLGANQDAWKVGQTFGMGVGNSMSYDTNNIVGAMATLSSSTEAYRGLRSKGVTGSIGDFFANNTNSSGE